MAHIYTHHTATIIYVSSLHVFHSSRQAGCPLLPSVCYNKYRKASCFTPFPLWKWLFSCCMYKGYNFFHAICLYFTLFVYSLYLLALPFPLFFFPFYLFALSPSSLPACPVCLHILNDVKAISHRYCMFMLEIRAHLLVSFLSRQNFFIYLFKY
jgi:hypothetical protein